MQSTRITDLPGLMYLWKLDNLYLAGQPELNSWNDIKKLGVDIVINLRSETEMDFSDQENKMKELGIESQQFPIIVNGKLDAHNCNKLSNLIEQDKTYFIHCGSANRVGAWLITYLVFKKGLEFDQAVEIATQSGLTNPGFIDQAEDVIEG